MINPDFANPEPNFELSFITIGMFSIFLILDLAICPDIIAEILIIIGKNINNSP